MTYLIEAASRHEAWLRGTEYLLQSGPALNVVLSVTNPGVEGPFGEGAERALDEFYLTEKREPVRTVADTIFPAWLYVKEGLRGILDTYPNDVYPHIKSQWGTYAYRIVRRETGEGTTICPLGIAIERMRRELANGRRLRSCYEIGVAEGEFDLPLYGATTDANKGRGGPCLSHLSFKLFGNSVHLTALYRSQDYRYKVVGNLLGLARLLDCVAREVGLSLGTLVVHSTYAYVDARVGIAGFRDLVERQRRQVEER